MLKKTALVLGIVMLLAVPLVNAQAQEARESWTGDPDPFACNTFEDCFWMVDVCIEGETYSVGIHFDPAESTAEEIEESALGWSGTELTYGACSTENVVIPEMWLLTLTDWQYPCILISESHPSVERQSALCFSGSVWEEVEDGQWYDPGWIADNAPCAGPVYDNGTPEGRWACDGTMREYGGARLPLWSDDFGGGEGTLWSVYQQHLSHIEN